MLAQLHKQLTMMMTLLSVEISVDALLSEESQEEASVGVVVVPVEPGLVV